MPAKTLHSSPLPTPRFRCLYLPQQISICSPYFPFHPAITLFSTHEPERLFLNNLCSYLFSLPFGPSQPLQRSWAPPQSHPCILGPISHQAPAPTTSTTITTRIRLIFIIYYVKGNMISVFTYILQFNHHSNSVGLGLHLFYRWRDWELKRLNDMPKSTQWVNVGVIGVKDILNGE